MTTTLDTLRARLHERCAALRAKADDVDAKGGTISPADQKALDDLSREVTTLSERTESAKSAAIGWALAGAAGSGAAGYGGQKTFEFGDDGAFREVGGGYSAGGGSLGAPPLAFSPEDIGDLFKAVGDRTICRKTTTTANAPMSLVPAYNLAAFPFLRDRTRLLDHIPVVMTEAPVVNYFRATTAASAATAVAEGAAKPLSSPVWESVSSTVRKLAHYVRINDEVAADYAGFMQLLGTELLSGLIDVETAQLLSGDGIAPNILGLLATTGILTRAQGADTVLDAIGKAINDVRSGSAFTESDTIVVHPTNWSAVALSKATGSGDYLAGSPLDAGPFTLWGVPVLVTTRIAAGTVMVANLKIAAQVQMRQPPTLEVAPHGGGTTEFIANQTLARAEERFALLVPRPAAICKVTLT